MTTTITDDQKKEYAELMHEYAQLMNDIENYQANKSNQSVNAASNDVSTTGASNQAAVTTGDPSTTQSDTDRLAELRAKLNIQ